MARELLSPVAILDATHGAARRAFAPWLGVYGLLVLPLRLTQVRFLDELFRIDAAGAARLPEAAWWMTLALLPAILGRALWARACHLSLQSGTTPGRETLRLPPAQLGHALYAGLLAEVFFGLTVWTLIFVPVALLAGGLATATLVRSSRPSILRPLGEIARLALRPKVALALLFTFGLSLLFVYLNLYLALRAAVWAFEAVAGAGLERWTYLLRPIELFPLLPAHPLTAFLVAAGTLLVVEPFWLAALSVYVHREKLQESGEDLRLRFRREVLAP